MRVDSRGVEASRDLMAIRAYGMFQKIIRLNIRDLDIEWGHWCESDWLAIYDGRDDDSKLLTRMCGRGNANSLN